MDYGTPKILPVTGGGVVLASTLTGQLVTVAAIAVTVTCIALLIRVLWRRKKSISE